MPAHSLTPNALWFLVIACSLPFSSWCGCASAPCSIPTGECAGQGMYVDYEAINKDKSDDVDQSRSKDGIYETYLKISRQQMYDNEALVFDIRSQRGELFNVDGVASRDR